MVPVSEELLVNVTPRETRVAVVENGMLQELHIERGSQRGVVGNIYKGKVQRVMPGMQAAFVDIGLERAAFLHANDVFRSAQLDAGESDDVPAAAPLQVQVPITELLRDGAEIVVQVVKDPIGSKGARLTTQISIPSRYLVLLPRSKVIGISARIEDEAERARLKALVSERTPGSGTSAAAGHGYIVRTNAEGQPAEALGEDIAYLGRVWELIEETVYRTNLEAAQSVARQLRLRNLGGIIIIDFIDMEDAEHRRQVLRTLEKALVKDHAKTTVYDFSPLGLVEMTRKRTVESLQRQLSEPCHECSGRGTVKTAETITYEVFREIVRAVRQFDAPRLLVIASPKLVTRITEEESSAVAELEEFLGKSIRFQADAQYLQEQFDVVLL